MKQFFAEPKTWKAFFISRLYEAVAWGIFALPFIILFIILKLDLL